jgi:hypothetical protein
MLEYPNRAIAAVVGPPARPRAEHREATGPRGIRVIGRRQAGTCVCCVRARAADLPSPWLLWAFADLRRVVASARSHAWAVKTCAWGTGMWSAVSSPRFPFSIQQDVHRIDVTACAPCLYTSSLLNTKQSFVWCSFSSLNTTNYETNRTHNCNLQG